MTSILVCDKLAEHIEQESGGVEGWGHAYLSGALAAFGLMAMAEAIRDNAPVMCPYSCCANPDMRPTE